MAKQTNLHYQKNGNTRSDKNAIYYKRVRRESKNLACIIKDVIYIIWFILYNVVGLLFSITFGVAFGFIIVIFRLIFNYHPETHSKEYKYRKEYRYRNRKNY